MADFTKAHYVPQLPILEPSPAPMAELPSPPLPAAPEAVVPAVADLAWYEAAWAQFGATVDTVASMASANWQTLAILTLLAALVWVLRRPRVMIVENTYVQRRRSNRGRRAK